jgi:hypothetical protein
LERLVEGNCLLTSGRLMRRAWRLGRAPMAGRARTGRVYRSHPYLSRHDGNLGNSLRLMRKERPMETSDHIDRERRRTKPKSRLNWARALLNPTTLKSLVMIGKLATEVVRLIFIIAKFMRD